jgi:3-methylcrotonyl-CoA carboxylase alpha subunit
MQNIRKVLIANRGEIACRIARTCRRLGLAVAGVHSSAERRARHVREIGESIELGGAASSDSYLNIEAIIAAAKRVGADAIHPGYGFVSENPAFVHAVEAAGLIFIGPTAETMQRLGGKASAKLEAARLGVPIIPGSQQGMADAAAVASLVHSMPLPVLLKAVAGGGGRGMAVIATLDNLQQRIASAMREAEKSFGNGELIVERYLPRVRHIEVQVAGDGQGNVIHLFERECSLQRRHQKVIEEAPAANLASGLRAALLADAVKLAAGVNYRGLGTVEFIVTGDEHYFLEVNPRLQVEHPVTEEVTGLDLVELQLQIADTGCLPIAQADVRCQGHAFEARLCAEDATAGFLPATGRIASADFSRAGVRIESGIASGDEITPHYDSMVAKLIAHGADREAARLSLLAGLRNSTLLGLPTNLDFLCAVLDWPETRTSDFHTRLIDERYAAADTAADASVQASPPQEHLAAAALHWLAQSRAATMELGCWTLPALTGWRLATGAELPAAPPAVLFTTGGNEYPLCYSAWQADGGCTLTLGEAVIKRASLIPLGAGRHLLDCDGYALELSIAADEQNIHLASALGATVFACTPYLGGAMADAVADGQLHAPMMGKVIAIPLQQGDALTAGQTVIVLESMKMELHVNAPFDGALDKLHCQVGDMVERGQMLAVVGAQSSAT